MAQRHEHIVRSATRVWHAKQSAWQQAVAIKTLNTMTGDYSLEYMQWDRRPATVSASDAPSAMVVVPSVPAPHDSILCPVPATAIYATWSSGPSL